MPALRPHPSSTVPFAKLIAALGVVYGDIGTSPLYALKECVSGPHGVAPTPANILGVVSLIFWSLTLVVVLKYLVFVLRADNNGEGGVLALMALVSPTTGIVSPRRLKTSLAYLGLFGAALLYGDGMLTPAVTVLSAVEGLELATPVFHSFVVPITCVVLILLFLIQRR
ncbi:MAG TPA: KUP/HAK/KT family potassium transporter, partial [Polyangia bacterium]